MHRSFDMYLENRNTGEICVLHLQTFLQMCLHPQTFAENAMYSTALAAIRYNHHFNWQNLMLVNCNLFHSLMFKLKQGSDYTPPPFNNHAQTFTKLKRYVPVEECWYLQTVLVDLLALLEPFGVLNIKFNLRTTSSKAEN